MLAIPYLRVVPAPANASLHNLHILHNVKAAMYVHKRLPQNNLRPSPRPKKRITEKQEALVHLSSDQPRAK
jgi:hypothetical protein